MAFKLNIADKTGKTYKIETESNFWVDKELGATIKGKDIQENLDGYEFTIAGASDKSGFMHSEKVEGQGIKKILLGYGKGMHVRPKKEGKKKQSTPKPKGLRLRKTVRGKILSEATRQINLKVSKAGKTTLKDIFEPKETPAKKTPKEE